MNSKYVRYKGNVIISIQNSRKIVDAPYQVSNLDITNITATAIDRFYDFQDRLTLSPTH